MELQQLYQALAEICSQEAPTEDHADLIDKIQQVLPDKSFHLSLGRGGWHRVGGVLNDSNIRIAKNLEDWIKAQSLEVDELFDKYKDSGYRVTRQDGITHYFTAMTGNEPDQFIQLEIEEIRETQERILFYEDYFPESLEELVDPDDFPRLEDGEVMAHRYHFRCITDIENYVRRMNEDSEYEVPLQRWFTDWKNSSASENSPFCHHWVLLLREYTDGYGEPRMEARPFSTYSGEIEELDPDHTMRGSVLANAIHDFDRKLGFSMAWYFFMLSRKRVSPRVAEAIHNDLHGAYTYLAPRDLRVLNQWAANPYTV